MQALPARLSTGCRVSDLALYITRLAIPHRLTVRLPTRPIEPDNQRVLIVTKRDDNTQSRFGFLSTFSRKVALNLKDFRSSPSQSCVTLTCPLFTSPFVAHSVAR
jgi:hypothetical protein